MIGIIDYGMGNLFSVSKALERMEVPFFLSGDIEELKKADGLILPGVGAFRDGMKALNENGLAEFILDEAENGTPLFGICLGMQLLFEESEENGLTKGLGILPGRVVRFKGHTKAGLKYKVPHMGWNKLTYHAPESPLLKNIPEDFVYFVHSYYVETDRHDVVLASANYDVEVPAVVGRGTIFGTQFHPEKSGRAGLAILKRFTDIVKGADSL